MSKYSEPIPDSTGKSYSDYAKELAEYQKRARDYYESEARRRQQMLDRLSARRSQGKVTQASPTSSIRGISPSSNLNPDKLYEIYNKELELINTQLNANLDNVQSRDYSGALANKPVFNENMSYDLFYDSLKEWTDNYRDVLSRSNDDINTMLTDELKQANEAEYERVVSGRPLFQTGESYSDFSNRVTSWVEEYNPILGRGEDNYSRTQELFETYDQEFERLNIFDKLGISAQGSNILNLTYGGRDLDLIKSSRAELKTREVDDIRQEPRYTLKYYTYSTVRDLVTNGTYADLVRKVGKSIADRLISGDKRGLGNYGLSTSHVDVNYGKKTEEYIEGDGDYLFTYYDDDKTKIKSIQAKPKEYTWTEYSNYKPVKKSLNYSDYLINFDEGGSLLSEQFFSPLSTRNFLSGDGWVRQYSKSPLVSYDISYISGNPQSIVKYDSFKTESTSHQPGWSEIKFGSNIDLKAIFEDNKLSKLYDYDEYESYSFWSGSGGSGTSMKRYDTYLAKEYDFSTDLATFFPQPNRKTEHSYVKDIVNPRMPNSIVFNPKTNIGVVDGRRVDLNKLKEIDMNDFNKLSNKQKTDWFVEALRPGWRPGPSPVPTISAALLPTPSPSYSNYSYDKNNFLMPKDSKPLPLFSQNLPSWVVPGSSPKNQNGLNILSMFGASPSNTPRRQKVKGFNAFDFF